MPSRGKPPLFRALKRSAGSVHRTCRVFKSKPDYAMPIEALKHRDDEDRKTRAFALFAVTPTSGLEVLASGRRTSEWRREVVNMIIILGRVLQYLPDSDDVLVGRRFHEIRRRHLLAYGQASKFPGE